MNFGKYVNRLPKGMPADQTRALSDVHRDLATDINRFERPGEGTGAALVAFLQSGTGAIATTVQEKAREVVSALDFMTEAQRAQVAARTEVLDLTAPCQAAIDSLPSGGGCVFFPDGLYSVTGLRIDGTAANKSRVWLRGDGWSTVVKLRNGSSGQNVIMAEGTAKTDLWVTDMTVDGNRANNPFPLVPTQPDYAKWQGVRLQNVERGGVVRCLIINCGAGAIQPGAANDLGEAGSQHLLIADNVLRDNNYALGAYFMAGCVVANNWALSNTTHGLVIDFQSTQCAVENNVCLGNGGNGIFAYRVDRCTFAGNVCRNNIVGFALDNASLDCTLTGNQCGQNSNTGIKVTGGCFNNQIVGNTCDNNAQYGIEVNASSSNTVSENSCRLNSFSGIGITAGSLNCQVNGNRANDNQGSGIFITTGANQGTCNGNFCLNNNLANNANDSGIRIVDSSSWTVVGNRCLDDRAGGSKTQNWGVRLEGTASDNVIMSNHVTANRTAGLSLVNTNFARHNNGFATETTGTAQITNPATFVDVAHGLAVTPFAQHIMVTPASDIGSASKFWVSNVGATNFRINVDVAPGGNIFFQWQAQVL